VITAEEIRQSGATGLPEWLRVVSGLGLFRTSALNVSTAAKGLDAQVFARMQVVADGLPVMRMFSG
jgi:hypothetical protein